MGIGAPDMRCDCMSSGVVTGFIPAPDIEERKWW